MAWHRFTLSQPPLGWTIELDRAVEAALGLRRWTAPTARLKHGLAFTWDGEPDIEACRALGGVVTPVPGPPSAWSHQDKDFEAAWAAYRDALEARAPEALRGLRAPASAEDVEVLWEAAELPSPLLAFLALHDGERDQVGGGVFPIWRPLSVLGMLDSKRFLDTLHADPGVCAADPGVHPVWWHPGWWPWATNGGGDYLCVDLDPLPGGHHGQVVFFDHAGDYREVLAESLTHAVDQLAADLADGSMAVFEGQDGEFWTLGHPESMSPGDLDDLRVR